ncbi:MAG: phospholipase D-like domain-containing protein [Cyclobacteriaceae bacterium]|nr:phospholipase D-like domain-containing protein [Cyclobacteriaceae bacterium]
MIIPKLLAPLINKGILKEAVHCRIATASISEDGFEMIMSRLPRKCTVHIVTGLHSPTNPNVLYRILEEYSDRVELKVFSLNVFHANVYQFDLPYRKGIAFVSSGPLTIGGLQKNEELTVQVEDEKEVEEIRRWFTRYFETSSELTKKLVDEYAPLFVVAKERENLSREEIAGLVSSK